MTSPYSDRPHHVYRLYGHDGTLLYVGCARDVEARIYMHETAWYSNDSSMAIREAGGIASHTSEQYPDRSSALAAERAAIRDEAPAVNKQGNPKRWRYTRQGYVPVAAPTTPPADGARAAAGVEGRDGVSVPPAAPPSRRT